MKTKIDLKIKPPKKSAFMIQTPDDMFKAHTLMVYSGKRGGGKSVACCSYIKKLLDLGIYDDTIIVSATYASNKEIYDMVSDGTYVLDPLEKDVVSQVNQIVQQNKDDYHEFLEKKKLYKEFKKDLSKRSLDLNDIYEKYGDDVYEFMEEPPKWKYKIEREPRFWVVYDDILGTPLLSSSTRGLTSQVIKHRHIADGLGISIAILVQSYASQQGLPRVIRENTTVLCLFSNTDDAQLKKIYDENINPREMSEESFRLLFDQATAEPYSFLTIDFNPKDKTKQFRKNFEFYLTFQKS